MQQDWYFTIACFVTVVWGSNKSNTAQHFIRWVNSWSYLANIYHKQFHFNCAQFYLMIFFPESWLRLSNLLSHDNPFFRWRLQTWPTVGGTKATAMKMWEVCGRFLHTDHIGPVLKYCFNGHFLVSIHQLSSFHCQMVQLVFPYLSS